MCQYQIVQLFMQMDTKTVHKIFGRHTNIGKSLHRIYNASQERNSYQPNVKLTLKSSNPTQEHLNKLKQQREEIRAKKKPVNIPYKRKYTKPTAKILLQRGRKPQHEIEKELIEYYEADHSQIYIPTKSRSETISDLQYTMETGSKRRPKLVKRKQNIVDDCKEETNTNTQIRIRMEELLNEINERQHFLQTMKECNSKKYRLYEQEMNRQISLKWQEFKQLDKYIVTN
eukprot:471381_1